MEVDCASYWRSIDATCEESEAIAHLQSLFWSSSDVDLDSSLCSSNVSYRLTSSSTFSINNNEISALVSSTPNTVLEEEGKVGNKRKTKADEENHGVQGDAPLAPAACKKSKTNSQSWYAKMRRERINERLRVLQQLIPNGTKVDISTMLDEAVQYVKFLHMQIKLLSSDETWMYAPLNCL